ncbi:MAG TPA: hypothetical protein VNC22_18055 [Sporichthya sp.]|jgi:hypothetical protein|nr:hypothetical protein [Sporichthya sp.]
MTGGSFQDPTSGPGQGAADAPYWGPPVSPPKKGRGKKILLVVLAVVGVVVLGFVLLVAYFVNDTKQQYDATASLQEGQCLSVTRMNTADPGVAAEECTSTAANYRIGVKLPSNQADCPAGDYDVYQQGARFSQDVTFCLVPIFVKGKCYLLTDAGTTQEPCRTTNQGTVIRIEQIVANSTDKKKCTKGNLALTYSKPATVFCTTTLLQASS